MFEGFDPVLLARIQFAFTVSFHFFFPAFTIGLASFLAVLNGLHLATGRQVYRTLFQYWVKIFAVSFAMGVVSGIVMSYQFGTNWSVFSDRTGPILGPMMAYEVLSAFFLEAGFLGVMLFGLNRVGKGLHMFATLMVAIGTLGSAFWILSVNSWMHTPAGYGVAANGQFVPEDWWAIVFNPSFPYRLAHTVLAAYLTTAFVVGGVGALHLLRDRHNAAARTMFSMALWMATVVAPAQIFMGDAHGLNTLEHQPMKIAAMEGHFETNRDGGMPLTLFGIPDMEAGRMRNAISIPQVGSLILTHSLDGEVRGLDQFPREDWPNVWIVFFTFRIMVGIGFAMLGIGLWSLVRRFRGSIYEDRWLQRAAVAMAPSGFAAVLAGWMTTEVGRQPYTVYGLLRTAESHSPVAASAVGTSLLAFIVVYFVVFGAGIYYILRTMGKAPSVFETGPDPREPIRTAGITPGPAMDVADGAVAGARTGA
ncbi:cytochrome ubiquinol oxidase subunit I [Aureimonas jatrophae]|uniref:Cytochrome bd-I ubiquinol oxidase subunit 1 apoprotein n=1 Tax=Aureimonas jatrophae TaxID=1166073 RepID=A0A1H0DPJ7_9HYPH|nr:cytochrome ubiquinol oxidase subunit I [Aureimonas jatrophae]MBB3952005.1 cytochrome d ubiquinol oxidase subunit I [Aureimonas jatrophae]SDN71973.1 cytochrome bd-I ubiquinol oxidase subunit 1 apoprotein [Aureimonas jatrophae]